MANIVLRPDLKTAGGEVLDIVVNDRHAGTITLVYREWDRVTGSIQLEKMSLSAHEKELVIEHLQNYVQSVVAALNAEQCDIFVTYSDYERVIVTSNNVGTIDEIMEDPILETSGFLFNEDEDVIYPEREEIQFNDVDPNDYDVLESEADAYFELVLVGEADERLHYHIYDERQLLWAEAFMDLHGSYVVGHINWRMHPTEDEIEQIADLLVSDFDENEIDSFTIENEFEGEIIETIELDHEDILDLLEEERVGLQDQDSYDSRHNEYSVILARDDGDTLTYEIYKHAYGGLPIGTATIDIGSRQMTGFIDFRDPGTDDDRDWIASLLMRELDKERDYESFNLSVMYKNELIDEMLFEVERIH